MELRGATSSSCGSHGLTRLYRSEKNKRETRKAGQTVSYLRVFMFFLWLKESPSVSPPSHTNIGMENTFHLQTQTPVAMRSTQAVSG